MGSAQGVSVGCGSGLYGWHRAFKLNLKRHPRLTLQPGGFHSVGMRLPRRLPALAVLCLAAVVGAQIGDKPGEPMVQIVPDAKIPPSPPHTPQEQLQTFQIAKGYQISLAASDPAIGDPVAATFGPDGRLWVVEMQGYMPNLDGTTEDQPHGRISVLEDTDGDGVFDKSTVFLDNIVMPRAIALHRDGVLVGAPPHLWFCRDTKGTGKCDERTEVATDFGVRVDPSRPQLANPERAPNALLWGHDNWLYVGAYTARFKFKDGRWVRGLSNFRGQWGLSQDDFGHLFHNSNSDALRADVIPSSYLFRNPTLSRTTGLNWKVAKEQFVWPARVNPGINRGYRPEMLRDYKLKEYTAACGPWIYRADLFPEDAYGNAFVCEPAGNLISRHVVKSVAGALEAQPYYDQAEFLTSTDERFRPVNLLTGPDGALYVIDLYRGIIQHRISLTTYLREQIVKRGLDKPLALGRVWRIAPEGSVVVPAKKLSQMSSAELVAELSSGNSWRRETAQRLLVEKGDVSVAAALNAVAKSAALPMARVHALWTLEGLGTVTAEALRPCLTHPDARVRAAAVRVSEAGMASPDREAIIAHWIELAASEVSTEVQQQLVLSMGEAKALSVDLAAAALANRAADTAFVQDALISGLDGRELEVFEAILKKPADYSKTLPAALLRCVFAERKAPRVEKALAIIAALPLKSQQLALLGALAGHPTVTAKRPVKLAAEPSSLAKLGQSKDAAMVKALAWFKSTVVWPGKPGVVVPVVKPLTNEEHAMFDSGKLTFTGLCAACHQTTGKGLDGLAPPLADSEWVNGDPERIVRVVMHGLRGPIKVKGNNYSYDMPAAGFLTDEQIASVLTYIRREWDHEASPVPIDLVKKIREQTKGRTDAWTEPELQKR
jgi:mono/diheme cytochrome c family protein/glucose/arabinose dehydrogenase